MSLSFKRLHNNDTDAWFRSQELQLGLLKSQLKKMQVTLSGILTTSTSLLMQATAKKMVKSRSSQLSTSRAFCQNLRGILDKSDEEERWEVVRGELPKEKKR